MSVENAMYVKKIIFGILLNENGKWLESIINYSAITCDEIIEAQAKL